MTQSHGLRRQSPGKKVGFQGVGGGLVGVRPQTLSVRSALNQNVRLAAPRSLRFDPDASGFFRRMTAGRICLTPKATRKPPAMRRVLRGY